MASPPPPSQQRLRVLEGHLLPGGSGPPAAAPAAGAGIPQRPLFRGGPMVGAIGFGAWPLSGAFGSGDQDPNLSKEGVAATKQKLTSTGIAAVATAVGDVGMTFIDTAEAYELEGYGGSETIIGKALAARPDLRQKAFVTTKVSNGPFTAKRIKKACERSMKRLQTDRIELLQLHHFYDKLEPWRPHPVGSTKTLPDTMQAPDKLPSIAEQMGALKELQDEGKIAYIGLNNATAAQLQQAWDTGVRFHTVQVRYHMFSRTLVEKEVVPWCREHGVGILAHSVYGKGLCTGKHPADKVWPKDDERGSIMYKNDFVGERWSGPNGFVAACEKLKAVAARKGVTLPELAIGWVLRIPEVSVALVGAKDSEQVRMNAKYVTLTQAEVEEIQVILDAAPETGVGHLRALPNCVDYARGADGSV